MEFVELVDGVKIAVETGVESTLDGKLLVVTEVGVPAFERGF